MAWPFSHLDIMRVWGQCINFALAFWHQGMGDMLRSQWKRGASQRHLHCERAFPSIWFVLIWFRLRSLFRHSIDSSAGLLPYWSSVFYLLIAPVKLHSKAFTFTISCIKDWPVSYCNQSLLGLALLGIVCFATAFVLLQLCLAHFNKAVTSKVLTCSVTHNIKGIYQISL